MSGIAKSGPLKVVQLTTDNRETARQYENLQPWFGTAPEALFQGFALLPEVEVHVITCTQRPMITSPERLAENIWFHSLDVPKFGWMRTAFQGCVRTIRRKIHEIHPDIVHGQGTERECAISAVLSGYPNVVTIHGNMAAIVHHQDSAFGRLYGHCASFLEGFALRRTRGVFCNSAHTESLVSRCGVRTWRVPNPLRTAFLSNVTKPAPPEVPVLLNIGSVVPWKRQVALLDAAHELHFSGVRFVLNFVGSLDERTAYGRAFCEKLARAKAEGYADHLGSLDLVSLIRVMDSASALVHVPVEEAFGLVVAEALARNLKVFATATGGVVDIVAGVDGAELFHGENWSAALVQTVRRWIESGATRPQNAAEVMAARYKPAAVARRHLEIYREVLARDA
jgi:glycosyltransferase involved in cell wall biosynthesis